MISSLQPQAQQFLDNLNRIGGNMSRAQRQIATGRRISQVSDEPGSVSILLQAHASLQYVQQTLTNLGRVKTEVDTAEQALQTATTLFDKVQTFGAQGNTDVLTAQGRAALADELDSILQQFVGLAGSAVEGRYLFSGDADQQVPYIYTPGQPNPVSAYLGSTSTRMVQDPTGSAFSVALTAQDIFDSADPTTNVFSSIQALAAGLRANDSPAIAAAVNGLNKVSQYLNTQLSFYGTTQNKVTAAADAGNTLKMQMQTQIGNLEDTDLTQAILELTQGQTQEQAALQSHGLLPRTTLFDYLG